MSEASYKARIAQLELEKLLVERILRLAGQHYRAALTADPDIVEEIVDVVITRHESQGPWVAELVVHDNRYEERLEVTCSAQSDNTTDALERLFEEVGNLYWNEKRFVSGNKSRKDIRGKYYWDFTAEDRHDSKIYD